MISDMNIIIAFCISTITLATIVGKWGESIFKWVRKNIIKDVSEKINPDELDPKSPLKQCLVKIMSDQEEMVNYNKENNKIVLDELKIISDKLERLEFNYMRLEIMNLCQHNTDHKNDALIRRYAVEYFNEGYNLLLLDDVNGYLEAPLKITAADLINLKHPAI